MYDYIIMYIPHFKRAIIFSHTLHKFTNRKIIDETKNVSFLPCEKSGRQQKAMFQVVINAEVCFESGSWHEAH